MNFIYKYFWVVIWFFKQRDNNSLGNHSIRFLFMKIITFTKEQSEMCGIICSLCIASNNDSIHKKGEIPRDLHQFLKNRGPDTTKECSIDGISFGGYVLWQQGAAPIAQPIVSNRFVLLFNGDIYNADKNNETSDVEWLINKLEECKNENEIIELFKIIQGPYSAIFYNKKEQVLYFCRDSLGRNSLLIERNNEMLTILSTSNMLSDTKLTCELPPLGLFKIDMTVRNAIELHPWKQPKDNDLELLQELSKKFGLLFTTSNDCIAPKWLMEQQNLEVNYDFFDLLVDQEDSAVYSALIKNDAVRKIVENLLNILGKSVKDRIFNTPQYCKSCLQQYLYSKQEIVCNHAKISILFSGGVDCTILAALANKFLDPDHPIDLINVAFESAKRSSEEHPNWEVPDRLSAIESHRELQKLYSSRVWNLIEVNVPREELQDYLKSHVRHLIYPLKTILDESLGCAFWFAARGKGLLNKNPYESNARVILIGSGADELFGGYTRHKNAFSRCKGNHAEKIKSLQMELDLDWKRLPSRNLGRDDRVTGDHGKTARAPFIEENVINFVRGLSPGQKCYFQNHQIVGDKLLLRMCAFHLGLTTVCSFKKRAIQFGSRIANKNQNASDLSAELI